ncbi:MAG: NADPH-dependent FMN reductase [Pseudomonadota bacterium]
MARDTITIVGLSGSLRAGSLNSALLRELAALAPEGVEVAIHSIAEVPLYNGDDEARDGLPPAVVALKAAIAEADGLLLCSPEYNGSVPGVLKNTIDWLSRTPEGTDPTLRGKPVAITGASPGSFGTTLGQTAWLPVMRNVGAELCTVRLLVPGAMRLFQDGKITDEAQRARAETFIHGFAAHLRGNSE